MGKAISNLSDLDPDPSKLWDGRTQILLPCIISAQGLHWARLFYEFQHPNYSIYSDGPFVCLHNHLSFYLCVRLSIYNHPQGS